MRKIYLYIGHSVVPVEKPGGDEVCYNHIHTVVFMSYKYTHHSHSTQEPTQKMVPPEGTW